MNFNHFLFFVFTITSYYCIAQPQISFDLQFSGYNSPVDIAAPSDGTERLFIVEKQGVIRIIENGIQLPTPFLDISSSVSTNSERGLLGLAFHPDYSNNGWFYTNYINNSGSTVISRWTVSTNDSNSADLSSQKALISIHQPVANHNAGDLNFSPLDGYLYIAMGDGGGAGDPWCNSQDSTTMLGKILRIDVNQNVINSPYYGIPGDNPFVSLPHVPNEVWALGLRNPWRTSFDRKNGDYWIADVGQSAREEVNYIPQGSGSAWNFGWNKMEGTLCYDIPPDEIITPCLSTVPDCNENPFTKPIFEYNRNNSTGGKSITGGFVYRGCDYPGMYGYYICSDFVSGNSWYMDNTGNASLFTGAPEAVTTFGEDRKGEIYAADLLGNIYRLVDSSIPEKLILTSADFPLSGTYEALDSIIITDPLIISGNELVFKTSTLKLPESVGLSLAGMIKMQKNNCPD